MYLQFVCSLSFGSWVQRVISTIICRIHTSILQDSHKFPVLFSSINNTYFDCSITIRLRMRPTTTTITTTTTLLLRAIAVALTACFFTGQQVAVNACSCHPFPTLESSFESGMANHAVVRLKIKREIPNGSYRKLYYAKTEHAYKANGLDNNNNADEYCTTMDKKLKKKPIVVETASSSSECGVPLEPGTTYVLFGQLTYERRKKKGITKKGKKKIAVLQVTACSFQQVAATKKSKKKQLLTEQEKEGLDYLEAQRQCRCGGSAACGEYVAPVDENDPAYYCPDGITPAGPPAVCEYDAESQACVWGKRSNCPTCQWDYDCNNKQPDGDLEAQQFCSHGYCRAMGTCDTVFDCQNPSNLYPTVKCVGFDTCDNGACGLDCGCPCPPSEEGEACGVPASCEEDPCQSTSRCEVDGAVCVSDYCACQPIWYARDGEQVCKEG